MKTLLHPLSSASQSLTVPQALPLPAVKEGELPDDSLSCFHTCPRGNFAQRCELCGVFSSNVIHSGKPYCTYFVAWQTDITGVWGFHLGTQGKPHPYNGAAAWVRGCQLEGARQVCKQNQMVVYSPFNTSFRKTAVQA